MAGGGQEEMSLRALQKRYESLVSVRSKAIKKGKGAWYWIHLEPILAQNPDSGVPKAVKLRCTLCAALFSASNPSRTASEHLKRGTCPQFSADLVGVGGGATATGTTTTTAATQPTPLASLPPATTKPTVTSSLPRKRPPVPVPTPVMTPAPAPAPAPASALVLSGGKEDLGALAVLENSVKRLKSPSSGKGGPIPAALGRAQAQAAADLLAEWLYESCGSVPISCMEQPKFRAFLEYVGLPPVSKHDVVGPRLDTRYEEVRRASEMRLRDALFFQLAADGWSKRATDLPEALINVTLNLPNGTSLFHKALVIAAAEPLSAQLIEDAALASIGGPAERCAGVVADTAGKQGLTALRELESKRPWMVNLPCQAHGVSALLKDFFKHLPVFRSVAADCWKLAALFSSSSSSSGSNSNTVGKPLVSSYCFNLPRSDEPDGITRLWRCPSDLAAAAPSPHYPLAASLVEDVASCARTLQVAAADGGFKSSVLAEETVEMLAGMRFWTDLEAVLALTKLVRKAVEEMEAERPSVSQCLPLWVDLRTKAKEWCSKYGKEEDERVIEQVMDKRFNKNYHPAWSAAFVLDPLYLLRDASGKYLPPFKYLTQEQEKDVDRLITRLVLHKDEAHVALMELMKWRANGLDPLYAQAVQMKERDGATGRMKAVSPQSRRLVWETCLSEFKALGKVAVRLIFLHATSSGLKCDWPIWKWVYRNGNSQIAADKAQKMIFIASHARLDRRDFATDDDKDGDLFANGGGSGHDEETISDEVFLNAAM